MAFVFSYFAQTQGDFQKGGRECFAALVYYCMLFIGRVEEETQHTFQAFFQEKCGFLFTACLPQLYQECQFWVSLILLEDSEALCV